MVLKTMNLIQKRRLKWDGNDISTSFMTVKKRITGTGKITYISDRSEEASHGDLSWAIMNCILNVPYGSGGNVSSVNKSSVFSFE